MGHERPILCVRCNSICLGRCLHKLGNARQNVLNPQAHSIFAAARELIRLNAMVAQPFILEGDHSVGLIIFKEWLIRRRQARERGTRLGQDESSKHSPRMKRCLEGMERKMIVETYLMVKEAYRRRSESLKKKESPKLPPWTVSLTFNCIFFLRISYPKACIYPRDL